MEALEMSVYDLNKQAMSSIKPMDKIAINTACYAAAKNIWDRYAEGTHFWMLLCREAYDFTIFQLKNDSAEFAKAIIECLENRGKVLSIEEQNDGNYEIWLRIGKENFVYYLFEYDNAVIEV